MAIVKLVADNASLLKTSQEYEKCFFLPEPRFDLVWSERYTTNLITALINFALVPFAMTANLLVILAITRNNPLHTPSNMLLSCLAFSDFLIGLIVQPLYGTFRMMENTPSLRTLCFQSGVFGEFLDLLWCVVCDLECNEL